MTSPYSSSLLHKSSADIREDQDTITVPRPGMRTHSVSHVVAQPQPVYAPAPAPQYAPAQWQPQPVVVQQQPGRSGGGVAAGVSALVLGLIVVLVGIVALVGGYYMTQQLSPSAAEAAVSNDLAGQEGYRAGQARGLDLGRADGASAASTAANLRSSLAAQRAWNTAYAKGLKAGQRAYRAPRYSGSGYRGRGYSYGGFSETSAALGQAQSIANATGAPVDVEIY